MQFALRSARVAGLGHRRERRQGDNREQRLESGNREAIEALIANVLKSDSADSWIAKMKAAGIPCGRVNSVAQALAGLGTVSSAAAPLPPAELAQLRKTLGAEVVFRTGIAGYGKIKPKWTIWLLGSGAVEGAIKQQVNLRLKRTGAR